MTTQSGASAALEKPVRLGYGLQITIAQHIHLPNFSTLLLSCHTLSGVDGRSIPPTSDCGRRCSGSMLDGVIAMRSLRRSSACAKRCVTSPTNSTLPTPTNPAAKLRKNTSDSWQV